MTFRGKDTQVGYQGKDGTYDFLAWSTNRTLKDEVREIVKEPVRQKEEVFELRIASFPAFSSYGKLEFINACLPSAHGKFNLSLSYALHPPAFMARCAQALVCQTGHMPVTMSVQCYQSQRDARLKLPVSCADWERQDATEHVLVSSWIHSSCRKLCISPVLTALHWQSVECVWDEKVSGMPVRTWKHKDENKCLMSYDWYIHHRKPY
jgi:hypothetical protein